MTTFSELGLSEPLLEALAHLGYERPTPIQEQAIPELLAGRDVIGQAQTGTGKTAAFGLPLLQYVDTDDAETQALVLTPTRELCIQVTQALRAYGRTKDVNVVAVFGGAPIRTQVAQLKGGAQVVVGTVGRVMDLMNRHELVLSAVRFVVLDEADEMLDLGFLEDVETILAHAPSGRQTALFSATMPTEIKRLAETRMFDPVTIKVRAATLTIDTVEQFYVEAPERGKAETLARVLKEERPEQAIVFVRTKVGVDRLARSLNDSGVRVKALHGDMSQGSRDGVMIAFKDGRERLLVATDIAARGLDISGVTHVVNYDMPNSPEIYVHRIGRTGRVGRSGRAITLVTPKQRGDLEAIERHANTEIGLWGRNGGTSRNGAPARDEAEEALPRRRRGRRERGPDAPVEDGGDTAAVEAREVVDAVLAEPEDEAVVARRESEPVAEAPVEADPVAPELEADRAEPEAMSSDAPLAEPETVVSEDASEPGEDGASSGRRRRRPRRETRRPRHTKPRRDPEAPRLKLVLGLGRAQGLEPADVIGAIVDNSHVEGEDVLRVRMLDRFTFVDIAPDRADDVVTNLRGHELRGTPLRLEVVGP